jgi:hypothetical protein
MFGICWSSLGARQWNNAETDITRECPSSFVTATVPDIQFVSCRRLLLKTRRQTASNSSHSTDKNVSQGYSHTFLEDSHVREVTGPSIAFVLP